MAADRPVLIAGGGIGGLALALALAQAGRGSVVLERRITPATEGAGIQIGPNGVHVLRQLGIADALHQFVGEPERLEVRDGPSARTLAELPLGHWMAGRHDAPYWVVHRRDLHGTLLAAAEREPRIAIRAGSEVEAVTQSEHGVSATSVSGETFEGAALVGADGLWSNVRRAVSEGAKLQFVGATATRTVIPAATAGVLARPAVGLWLTPGVHVVHYPVRRGSEIAVVIIAAEDWEATGWEAHADAASVQERLAVFHPMLAEVLGRAADWRRWALYRLPKLPAWTEGRVTLMGDAAHPMLPYLAQGGVMALEDALVLAACLKQADEPSAFARYEHLRRRRTARVQALSARNGRVYHLPPPFSWIRDGVLRLLPGRMLMARFDWLYGWQHPAD